MYQPSKYDNANTIYPVIDEYFLLIIMWLDFRFERREKS